MCDSAMLVGMHQYDIVYDKWISLPNMPEPSDGGICVAHNGLIYYTCGSFSSSFWAYDIHSSKWMKKSNVLTIRTNAGAVVNKDVIFVCGGYSSYGMVSLVEMYDIASDCWILCTGMQNPRMNIGLVVYGKTHPCIDVIGGVNKSYDDSATVEMFDITRNRWSTVCGLPVRLTYCRAFTIGEKIVVIGFHDDYELCVIEGDIQSHQWQIVYNHGPGMPAFQSFIVSNNKDKTRRNNKGNNKE